MRRVEGKSGWKLDGAGATSEKVKSDGDFVDVTGKIESYLERNFMFRPMSGGPFWTKYLLSP